eukprot:m51a1_g8218 hypothetical protein (1086) ;mRNA; r:89997-97815
MSGWKTLFTVLSGFGATLYPALHELHELHESHGHPGHHGDDGDHRGHRYESSDDEDDWGQPRLSLGVAPLTRGLRHEAAWAAGAVRALRGCPALHSCACGATDYLGACGWPPGPALHRVDGAGSGAGRAGGRDGWPLAACAHCRGVVAGAMHDFLGRHGSPRRCREVALQLAREDLHDFLGRHGSPRRCREVALQLAREDQRLQAPGVLPGGVPGRHGPPGDAVGGAGTDDRPVDPGTLSEGLLGSHGSPRRCREVALQLTREDQRSQAPGTLPDGALGRHGPPGDAIGAQLPAALAAPDDDDGDDRECSPPRARHRAGEGDDAGGRGAVSALSGDVLLAVLSFVETVDDLVCASGVCRAWRAAATCAQADALWQRAVRLLVLPEGPAVPEGAAGEQQRLLRREHEQQLARVRPGAWRRLALDLTVDRNLGRRGGPLRLVASAAPALARCFADAGLAFLGREEGEGEGEGGEQGAGGAPADAVAVAAQAIAEHPAGCQVVVGVQEGCLPGLWRDWQGVATPVWSREKTRVSIPVGCDVVALKRLVRDACGLPLCDCHLSLHLPEGLDSAIYKAYAPDPARTLDPAAALDSGLLSALQGMPPILMRTVEGAPQPPELKRPETEEQLERFATALMRSKFLAVETVAASDGTAVRRLSGTQAPEWTPGSVCDVSEALRGTELQFIWVRQSYLELRSIIAARLSDPDGQVPVLLTGTPGTGKTALFYLLLRDALLDMRAGGPPVALATRTHSSSEWVLFEWSELRGARARLIREVLGLADSPRWFFDDVAPAEMLSKYLLCSSPDGAATRQAARSAIRLYLPTWSLEEMLLCNELSPRPHSAQDVAELRELWEDTLQAAAWPGVLRDGAVKGSILHLEVATEGERAYRAAVRTWASPRTLQRLMEIWRDRRQIDADLWGAAFECFAQGEMLREGCSHRMRSLESGSGSEEWFVVPPRVRRSFASIDALARELGGGGLAPGLYYRPCVRSLVSGDAFALSGDDNRTLDIYQMVVAPAHPLKCAGLQAICRLQKLHTTDVVRLIFVVPPERFPGFSKQRIVCTEDEEVTSTPPNDWMGKIRQFCVELNPFD